MSANETIVIAPWIGPMSCKNAFTVAVLSTNDDINQNICKALKEVHSEGNFKWKLVSLSAPNLNTVVEKTKFTGNIAIDFIVLALDTTRVFCIEWVRGILAEVHPDLRKRRVIIVNASGIPINNMAVDASEILSLQDDYDIDLLTSNVSKPKDAMHLAQRIIGYFEAIVGIKTGFSNLNL